MLFLPPGAGIPTRVHGAFVSDEEVHRVVADCRTRGEPVYIEEITQSSDLVESGGLGSFGGEGEGDEGDALYESLCYLKSKHPNPVYGPQELGYEYPAKKLFLESKKRPNYTIEETLK